MATVFTKEIPATYQEEWETGEYYQAITEFGLEFGKGVFTIYQNGTCPLNFPSFCSVEREKYPLHLQRANRAYEIATEILVANM
jgi:hypothetical protein